MPAEIGCVGFCACERCSWLTQLNELCHWGHYNVIPSGHYMLGDIHTERKFEMQLDTEWYQFDNCCEVGKWSISSNDAR